MMNRLEAAARQALEALDQIATHVGQYDLPGMPNHITTLATLHRDALREALAEQAAESDRSGCAAGSDEECTNRHCATKCPALAEQQAAEPNAVLVEGFGRVAMRKLNDLHEKGYAINGVSIATISEAGETELGAVTTGGRVLWWPQQQAAEPVVQKRCHLCDCTGDIHSADGEWRGECPYCKPTQQPLTIPEGYKVVPVDRSYDMRVQAMLHFNTAHKAGADRDDCLEAAWQATLAAAHSITGKKGGAA